MNKFLTYLLTKGITEADYGKKSAEDQAKLFTEYVDNEIAEVNEMASKASTKEDFDALTAKINDFDLTATKTLIADLDEQIKVLKDNSGKDAAPKSLYDDMVAKSDDLKKMIKGGKAVVLKADTISGSIVNNTSAFLVPTIGQLGRVKRSLYNIFPKIPIPKGNHDGTIRYIDWTESTSTKAAAVMAEGGTYAESTAKFAEYTLNLRKIGDSIPVSEEFGEDNMTAAAELGLFIDTNVKAIVDYELALGDGSGSHLKGLVASVPAYTAAASGITAPNIYDLVKKVRTDIVKTRGSKYEPDFVAMNANTLDELELTKDANENYIFKNDKAGIGSMLIVEDNNLEDNTLVVGDSRFGRIYEMGGVEVSKALSGTQFVEDMITIKARKRILFLIRTVDQTGFRKVASISASLVTLAS